MQSNGQEGDPISLLGTVLTKDSRWGGFNSTHRFSHSSQSSKAKIQVCAGLVPGEDARSWLVDGHLLSHASVLAETETEKDRQTGERELW